MDCQNHNNTLNIQELISHQLLPTYLIVEELVIRDRFKKLLHGDEEASGSPKNDGHKQGDAQPQKLTLINHFHFLFGSWWSQSFMLTCINA